jgi:hypothetical protein
MGDSLVLMMEEETRAFFQVGLALRLETASVFRPEDGE